MDPYCEFCERNIKAFAKQCWNCKRIFEHADYVHFKREEKDPHIEPYTVVKLTDSYKEELKKHNYFAPFGEDDRFLFVHEINGMPGHVWIIGLTTGKNYIGFHEENFVEVSDKEL